MSTYWIDSEQQKMVTTGIVEAVKEWIDGPDGKRRPGDVQARDEDTGMPLWGVEVSYRSESFGREYTVNAMVTVGAVEMPRPAPYTHITFEGLRVSANVNKAGGFSERWAAEAVRHMTPDTGASGGRLGKPELKPGDAKAVA